MTIRTHGLMALTVLAALAGCETSKIADTSKTPVVETRSPGANASNAGANAGATPQSRVASVDLGAKSAAAAGGAALLAVPTQRVLYFDFDSYAIKDDYKGLIEGYAKVLAANRGKRLVIEGHTDERGGREYNLALGQKRAAAVVKSLELLGAGDTQLEAVSFGEERPAAQGADETAWSRNRRAELKDR
jgi:peptidoglycan-associated lipoprotein